MNVIIETEIMYLNVVDGEIAEMWYSEEAATDWQKVYGGVVEIYEKHNYRPQPCTRDLPMPVVLDAEITARIIDRITAQQEAEWHEEASDEEREADRIAALYEDYLIERG